MANPVVSGLSRTKCPQCQSTNTATILYGLVGMSDELQARIDGGEVVLGGCYVSENDPDLECNDCGFRFRSMES